MDVKILRKKRNEILYNVIAYSNTWMHTRRKKRKQLASNYKTNQKRRLKELDNGENEGAPQTNDHQDSDRITSSVERSETNIDAEINSAVVEAEDAKDCDGAKVTSKERPGTRGSERFGEIINFGNASEMENKTILKQSKETVEAGGSYGEKRKRIPVENYFVEVLNFPEHMIKLCSECEEKRKRDIEYRRNEERKRDIEYRREEERKRYIEYHEEEDDDDEEEEQLKGNEYGTSMCNNEERKIYMDASIFVQCVHNNVKVQIKWNNGTAGPDVPNDLLVYLKNNITTKVPKLK